MKADLLAEHLHNSVGEGVGEEDDHGNNEHVDCQGLDHCQTDQHDGHDLATCARVTGNTFNGLLNGQTLADTGTERTETHADPGCDDTPSKKFHFYDSFFSFLFSYTV